MAHNLNFKNDKASFFSAKEIAWHGLGTITEHVLTSKEAIKAAQLDFQVGLSKLYVPVLLIPTPDTFLEPSVLKLKEETFTNYYKSNVVPEKYATYRKDTGDIFGIVGSKYEVIQNQEAFDFFDDIVGQGKAIYETAGALGKGETIFVTAKLPSNILVNGKDCVDLYLLFTSSHDGTGAIQILFTPIRVVCNNTLSMALQGAKFKYSIKHTKNAKDRLNKAAEVLGIAKNATDELQDIYNILAKTRIEDDKINEFFTKSLGLITDEDGALTVRSKNILDEVVKYNFTGIGQDEETCKGTLFGVYNAVTGYFQNVKSYKSQEEKLEDIMFNTGAKKISTALNLAKSLANI